MNYLVDTCVISEYTRKKKNERVIGWLKSILGEVYLSQLLQMERFIMALNVCLIPIEKPNCKVG